MAPVAAVGIASLLGLAIALLAGQAPASEVDAGAPVPAAAEPEQGEGVRPGAVVHLRYTLTGSQGEPLDSTEGRMPLVFTVGTGEVIPGLERALLGMRTGETKRITVSPGEAYGAVDPEAVTEVDRALVPPEAQHVGARVRAHTRSGREVMVRVREVRDVTIVLHLNHPLAGQTLVFEVSVILVEPP